MGLPTVTMAGNISFMEEKYNQDGQLRISFTVGAGEKDRDGKWVNLNIGTTVFGKTAEFMREHFKGGDPIIITGKLVEDRWTDNNGVKKSKIKIRFPEISFVPKVRLETSATTNYQTEQNQQTNQYQYGQQDDYKNQQNAQQNYNNQPQQSNGYRQNPNNGYTGRQDGGYNPQNQNR